ncbi:MAG TPA: hypothetical protein VME92_20430 [Acetobacteraceae bacterium]|nr:hypothetical protein [Acetobacteraceae bacterium]
MASVSWKNNVSGNWNTAANWSTGIVPGAGDDVTISTSSVQTITHSAGTHSVASLYTSANDTLAMTGGSLSVLGIATLYGAVTQSAGTLSFAGGNSTAGGVVTQTAGTIAITSGTLTLTGTGNSFAGAVNGAAIDFSSGSDTLQSTATLSVHRIELGGATLTLSANLSQAGTWDQSSGTLALGGNTLALSGPAHFDGGAVTGSGTITLSGSTSIGSYYVEGSTIVENSGTVDQTASWWLGYSGPDTAQFINESTGTLQIDAASTIYGTTGALLTNAGKLIVAGSGISAINVSLHETGTVQLATGTLRLAGASNTISGVISGGGTLEFEAGADTLQGITGLSVSDVLLDGGNVTLGSNLSYAKTWTQTAGTLAPGGHTLTVSGAADLDGGAATGTGSIAVSGSTEISGYYLEGSTILKNSGVLTQQGSLYVGYSGADSAQLQNLTTGTYDILANASIYGTTDAKITNSGTMVKLAGGGVSQINVALTNSATLTVASGTLRLDGTTNVLGGTVGGAGTLELNGGTDTLKATLPVAHLLLDGAAVTLGLNIVNATDWSQTAGTLSLGGHTLTLNGTSSLDGGLANGSGTILMKTGEISSYTLEGSTILKNAGAINQVGALYVGYNSGDTAQLVNQAGKTYTIQNNAEIYGTTGALITNAGTMVKSGNSGLSQINVSTTSTGKVTVSSGTLRFNGPTNSFTGTIAGNGTAEFIGGADSFGAGLAVTVASSLLDGANLTLGESLAYAGTWTQTTGTLSLGGYTLTLSGSANLDGGVASGSGTIAVSGTTELSGYALEGSSILVNTGTMSQVGNWFDGYNASDTPQVQNASGGTFNLYANTSMYATVGAKFSNAGTLNKYSGGTSVINASTTNTGTINVSDGVLRLAGPTNAIGGTVTGGGALELNSGADALSPGLSLSVGTLLLDGATATLGGSLSYANDWSQASGTLALGGYTLTLSGTNSITGGVVNGSGTLSAGGTTSLSGLALEGAAVLRNAGTMTQTGSWYLGYNASDTSKLINQAGATFKIANNSLIYGSVGASLTNSGTLVKSGGGGNSSISVATINSGTVEVGAGSLTFLSTVSGGGGFTIDAGTSLAFNAAVAAGGTVTMGATSNLAVSATAGFGDTISGFALGDVIDLQGMGWNTTTSFSFNTATDKLSVTNGSVSSTLQLAGSYSASSFRLFSDHGIVAVAHS